MRWTLDLTMEKLLHALQELIILKRKIINETLDSESIKIAILDDIISDLAEGIAHYLSHTNPKEFSKEVLKCHFSWDLAKIFKENKYEKYLSPPYFSNQDLEKIR